MATGFGADISQPYLSLIEGGRASRISLPKVLTIAAIYAVEPGEIIARMSREALDAMQIELAEWRAAGQPMPRPLRYHPRAKKAADAEIQRRLLQCGEPVSIPLGAESDLVQTASVPIVLSLAAANLAAAPSLADAFFESWSQLPSEFSREGTSLGGVRIPDSSHQAWWHGLAGDFRDWLTYVHGDLAALFKPLGSWRADFGPPFGANWKTPDEIPLTCELSDVVPGAGRAFGCRGCPISAVIAIRWRQIAQLLYTNKEVRNTCPPHAPNIADAAIDYLVGLTGRPFGPPPREGLSWSMFLTVAGRLNTAMERHSDQPAANPHAAVAAVIRDAAIKVGQAGQ